MPLPSLAPLTADDTPFVLQSPFSSVFTPTPLVGESAWALAARAQIPLLAQSSGLLAVVGEPGTGKTLLARLLHAHSPRATEPCMLVDLRGMSHEKIPEVLFDDMRRGTCILQGVETLPAVLQERCLQVRYRAQVILEVRGREGALHRGMTIIPAILDLVGHRILHTAPMSQRREDVLPIAEHYLRRYAQEWGRPIPVLDKDSVRLLRRAHFADHVRGVIAAVAHALHEAGTQPLAAQHFPPAMQGRNEIVTEAGVDALALEELVEQKLARFFTRLGTYDVRDVYETVISRVERPLFRLVLAQAQGNQVRAARTLGINRNTLRTRLRKFGLL